MHAPRRRWRCCKKLVKAPRLPSLVDVLRHSEPHIAFLLACALLAMPHKQQLHLKHTRRPAAVIPPPKPQDREDHAQHPQFSSSTLRHTGVGCSDTRTHTAAQPRWCGFLSLHVGSVLDSMIWRHDGISPFPGSSTRKGFHIFQQTTARASLEYAAVGQITLQQRIGLIAQPIKHTYPLPLSCLTPS